MCGILAVNSESVLTFDYENSLRAIKHRGPDDQGVFFSEDKTCTLGQVRLSILDLSKAGHQPMVDSSGRFIMSYNGEVYNYLDLKEGLERVYGIIPWKSNTDTEVILEGYALEGKKFLGKLNGIFAISIYDKKEKSMIILRDPLGIKPLYYTQQQNTVSFCSELKGLLCIKNLKRTLRKQSLADQLAFTYVPEPFTMYNEFFKVEPGCLIEFKNGIEVQRSYLYDWMHEPIQLKSENDTIAQLRTAFETAVNRQLISDVPMSLFLSGGLDSSAIAYEAMRKGANIKDAYTISFSKDDLKFDQQGDDLYYAKKVSSDLGLKLNVFQPKKNIFKLLEDLIPYLDNSTSDPSLINTFLISQHARDNGIKVMLSGQGADEYLGGYRRYVAEKMIRKIPKFSRNIISSLGSLIPVSVSGSLNATFRRAKKFSEFAGQKDADRFLSMYMWSSPSQISDLFVDNEGIDVGKEHRDYFNALGNEDILKVMLKVDQKYDLRSLNLRYTDKMSMAVGVEARVPFLDFELVQLMNSLSSDLLIKGKTQKYIFKKAMEGIVPKEVIYRKKAGFGLPLRAWLRDENEFIKYYFQEERIRKQGIYKFEKLKSILDEQFLGKKDNSYMIFSMLTQQMWLEDRKITI